MKKLIALILSLSMVILIFASCDTGSEDPSAVGEDNTSQESSAISEISVLPEESSVEISSVAEVPSLPQETPSLIDLSTYPKVTIYGQFSQPVVVSPEEAVEFVKGKMTVSNIEDYSFDVECHTSESGDYYFIRVFSTAWFEDVQIMMGHTIGWYKVDATTGSVTKEV